MKIIAEGECWSQKWSQDGADTESVSVSIRPAVLLCTLPPTYLWKTNKAESLRKAHAPARLGHIRSVI